MRILIISTFFPPLNSIASLRPYSWAKTWTEAGHEVAILTTSKTHTNPKQNLEYSLNQFKIITIEDSYSLQALRKGHQKKKRSLFHSLFNKIRKKTGMFSACRMPDFADLWASKALKKIKQEGAWDLVISTSGPYAVHRIGYHLKKNNLTKKWIADYRDLWTGNHIYKGFFPLSCLENYLERRWLKEVDFITTVSQELTQIMQKKYSFKKCKTFENGLDLFHFSTLSKKSFFPDDGKFRCAHIGTLYEKMNPHPFFKALSEIKNRNDFEVIFAGPTDITPLIEQYNLFDCVKYLGFLHRNDALRILRDASLLVFFPWTDSSSDGILSGRIFEYIASKTAIVTVGMDQKEASMRLIDEAQAGTHLGTNVSKIRNWLLKPNLQKNTISIDFLEKYSKNRIAKELLKLW